MSENPIAVFGQLFIEGFKLISSLITFNQSDFGPIFSTKNHKTQIIPYILFNARLSRFNVLKYGLLIVGRGLRKD